MSKHEKQPSEGSALLNVFGSHVSLAELNGDIASRANSRVPSRVSTPQPVNRDVNTKRARSRTITQKPRKRLEKLKLGSIILRCAILYASGALSVNGAAHFVAVGRLGPELKLKFPEWVLLISNIAGVLAVAIGLLFATSSPASAAAAAPSAQLLHTHYDWPSFIRGVGAILGLCYATTKVQAAWMFWALANPVLWYVIDSSVQGFAYAAVFSVFLGGIVVSWLGSSLHEALIILSYFFSAAILWGGLGRRLL